MEFDVFFPREGDRRRARTERKPGPMAEPISEKLPRITRMLALAHHLDRLCRRGTFKDYADMASVAGLTRARITQIMNLLHLSSAIQEMLLTRPEVARGLTEREIARVAAQVRWSDQLDAWEEVVGE